MRGIARLSHLQFLTLQQRREHQLRNVFRQRRNRRYQQRRRSAEKDSDRQRLAQLFRRSIMKPAALLNLPMQTGSFGVVNLHAIDAQIVLLRSRMFRVNQRQRDEWPAVFLPRGDNGQTIELRRLDYVFGDRRARNLSRSQSQKLEAKLPMTPEF